MQREERTIPKLLEAIDALTPQLLAHQHTQSDTFESDLEHSALRLLNTPSDMRTDYEKFLASGLLPAIRELFNIIEEIDRSVKQQALFDKQNAAPGKTVQNEDVGTPEITAEWTKRLRQYVRVIDVRLAQRIEAIDILRAITFDVIKMHKVNQERLNSVLKIGDYLDQTYQNILQQDPTILAKDEEIKKRLNNISTTYYDRKLELHKEKLHLEKLHEAQPTKQSLKALRKNKKAVEKLERNYKTEADSLNDELRYLESVFNSDRKRFYQEYIGQLYAQGAMKIPAESPRRSIPGLLFRTLSPNRLLRSQNEKSPGTPRSPSSPKTQEAQPSSPHSPKLDKSTSSPTLARTDSAKELVKQNSISRFISKFGSPRSASPVASPLQSPVLARRPQSPTASVTLPESQNTSPSLPPAVRKPMPREESGEKLLEEKRKAHHP